MRALLILELRRQRAVVFRLAGLTACVGVLFFLVGKRSPSDLLAAMIGTSLGAALIVPMGIARDKLEGTLEFLCGLPVEPRWIAASRLASMAVVSAPWSTGIAVLSLAVPTPLPMNFVGVAAVSWLVLTMLGAAATAFLTLFDLEQMLGAPVVGLVLAVVLIPRAAHWLIPGLSAASLLSLLNEPAAPVLLFGALMATVATVWLLSLAATTRGFARYRRSRD